MLVMALKRKDPKLKNINLKCKTFNTNTSNKIKLNKLVRSPEHCVYKHYKEDEQMPPFVIAFNTSKGK